MKNPKYKHRFGLILEAYCRGIGNQLSFLLKQVEVVEKLSMLAQEIKSSSDSVSLIKSTFLRDTLRKNEYDDILSNCISPLNRSNILGKIEYLI